MNNVFKVINNLKKHPLSKGRFSIVLLRFLFWQFSSRIYSKPVEKKYIMGTKLWLKRGWTGVTGNYYLGLHEFEDMMFLLHFLRQGDIFFDIGANMGSYTILASGIKKSISYTFEPVPNTFNCLLENIKLNNLENLVYPINEALGSAEGEIFFTNDQDTTNHVIMGSGNKGNIMVKVNKLDNLLKFPIILKIDVEGYETEVLNGMTASLQNETLKAIIIELNGSGGRYGYDETDIHEKLLKNGFKPYSYDPFVRSLNELEFYGKHNTIYCRDISFVKTRVLNSEHIILNGRTI